MALYVVSNDPRFHVELAEANTDYPLAIPPGANAVMLWFAASAEDATPVTGRLSLESSETPLAPITDADVLMGYAPNVPIELGLDTQYDRSNGVTVRNATHLHLAAPTAGAVVRGTWMATQ